MQNKSSLLRDRAAGGHTRVTFVELFFDLVFVFAVTQLSHLLLQALTPANAFQTMLLVLAVWWVWIYTAWVTNWLDPNRTAVRLLLFALMLAGLILASAIPEAFAARGLWFALAYVFMQVGRCLFMLWCLAPRDPNNFINFQRITVWLVLSAVFWIAGGIAEGSLRLSLWSLAMAIEFISPSLGFWTPRLGRSRATEWNISGEHMAERCGLFVIIALGESILITGATFSGLGWSGLTLLAFAASLIGSIAMWWIYFNIGAERASRLIAESDVAGRPARLAYTYIHTVIVAGIIVCAVADEIVLKHPIGHQDVPTAVVLAGGPALFILGCTLFKWATAGWPPLSHFAGLGMLLLLFFAAPALDPILLAIGTSLVMVAVAAWETISLTSEGGTRPVEPDTH